MVNVWMSDEEYRAEQAEDTRQMEQERLIKSLRAAMRREPSPREIKRALVAWEG